MKVPQSSNSVAEGILSLFYVVQELLAHPRTNRRGGFIVFHKVYHLSHMVPVSKVGLLVALQLRRSCGRQPFMDRMVMVANDLRFICTISGALFFLAWKAQGRD